MATTTEQGRVTLPNGKTIHYGTRARWVTGGRSTPVKVTGWSKTGKTLTFQTLQDFGRSLEHCQIRWHPSVNRYRWDAGGASNVWYLVFNSV